LLCRNKGAGSLLILPGGKIECGESHLECLRREIIEELGPVAPESFEFVGTYVDVAAGRHAGKTVRIDLYTGELAGTPEASSEVGELVWFGEDGDWTDLAPSLVNKILPDLMARGLLAWNAPHCKIV
jgi:8-oxo-dGTP pyrophosphatase MutT (NUDIX family)